MSDNIWKNIVRLHNEAKGLILVAEEFDKGFRDYLQPILEQRHTLEHIIRIRSAELGMIPDSDDNYIKGNLHKALGHEYRIFFDVADWLSWRIREKFIELFSPYSNTCISEVAPAYYQIRPKIETLNKEIAGIRCKKDISKKDEMIIEEVEHYRKIIEELLESYNEMNPYIPLLEEYKKKEIRKSAIDRLWQFIIGLGLVATGALFSYLIMRQ